MVRLERIKFLIEHGGGKMWENIYEEIIKVFWLFVQEQLLTLYRKPRNFIKRIFILRKRRSQLNTEIEQLNDELAFTKECVQKLKVFFPEVEFMFDIWSNDKETIINGLQKFCDNISDYNDVQVEHFLDEMMLLQLAYREEYELRQQFFDVREAIYKRHNEFSVSAEKVFICLKKLLKSENMNIKLQPITELCRLLEMKGIDRIIKPSINEMFLEQLQLYKEQSNRIRAKLIESIPKLISNIELFQEAFSEVIKYEPFDDYKLRKLIDELKDNAFFLKMKDLKNVMKSPELSNAIWNNNYSRGINSIYQQYDPDHINGRIWRRIPVTGEAHCETVKRSHDKVQSCKCGCQIEEISFRGFFSPQCKLDVNSKLFDVSCNVKQNGASVSFHAESCRITNSHKSGRGIIFDDLNEGERKKLFAYIISH